MSKRLSIIILLWCLSAGGMISARITPTPSPTPAIKLALPIKLPTIDPIDVAGDISIAGSSTVFPLTEKMLERFEEGGYSDRITDESIGTGAGFERFCVAGDTDISNASRAIKDTEIEACLRIDREPVEFRVGTDALVVAVSNTNDFADDLTLEELALVFSTAEKWSDVRAEFPDETILRFAPGTESGTFDYFVEYLFDGEEAPLLATSNLRLSEDDNVLVTGVESSPYAVGFFGFAYFQENVELLTALAINGIAPDEQTAEDATYPLARPLFIYSDVTTLREKPQVAAFINYYLTHVNEEILRVGYFPASIEALNAAKQQWLDVVGE